MDIEKNQLKKYILLQTFITKKIILLLQRKNKFLKNQSIFFTYKNYCKINHTYLMEKISLIKK